jgi:hypothetical protein
VSRDPIHSRGMDVVSACPLRVASMVWRPRPDAFALTVVCKATYVLAPGTAPPSNNQEEPSPRDVHAGEDERQSLVQPSDLVPFKRRCDVMLVGHAYAPDGQPVTSLRARLAIGEIDKTIAIHGDRFFTLDGQLVDPARFVRAELRWERAAGGPGTANPVGMRLDAPPDVRGAVAVPNLTPPDAHVTRRSDAIPPTGFGPIAPTWPVRWNKLHHRAASWDHRRWTEAPLPDDIDTGYFNAAPEDQQVAELRPDERILLENLHPSCPRLVTYLEALSPHALADTGAGPAQEVRLRCDTLLIDTDRRVVTLTWRGNVPLHHPAQPGRVVVTLEKSAPRLADVPAASAPVSSSAPPSLPAVVKAPAKLGGTVAIDPAIVRAAAPMPFTPSAPAPAPEPAEPGLPLADYPLERCAAITASIARRKDEKDAILERSKLTSERWAELDRHWNEAVQLELERGKTGLLSAYDSAYVAQLEAERGAIGVEEYARLAVAAEAGVEKETLAELDLPRGAMLRLRRVWLKKTSEDAALARRVRKAIDDLG